MVILVIYGFQVVLLGTTGFRPKLTDSSYVEIRLDSSDKTI